MKDVIVITGPTASGKTAVSIRLAIENGGEIVNADSMQVYKGCDIGTAKPSVEELRLVPHHVLDVVDPKKSFSVAEYKKMALTAMHDIQRRGKRVVITGGTGLYIDALVKNINFDTSKGTTQARSRYREVLREKGPDSLYGILKQRDPQAASAVHPNNTRRVIRYLEILEEFEGSLDEYMKNALKEPGDFRYKVFALWPEREFIYKRIEERIDKMLEVGLVGEVRGLLDSGIDPSLQSMQGIGYKETIEYINGNVSYDEFVETLKRNSRRYAKRQFTWTKRYEDAVRIPVDGTSEIAEITEKIAEYLLEERN